MEQKALFYGFKKLFLGLFGCFVCSMSVFCKNFGFFRNGNDFSIFVKNGASRRHFHLWSQEKVVSLWLQI